MSESQSLTNSNSVQTEIAQMSYIAVKKYVMIVFYQLIYTTIYEF